MLSNVFPFPYIKKGRKQRRKEERKGKKTFSDNFLGFDFLTHPVSIFRGQVHVIASTLP